LHSNTDGFLFRFFIYFNFFYIFFVTRITHSVYLYKKSLHYFVKFTIKDVCETVPFEVCEAFAQHMGFENLEALRTAVGQELQQNADHLAFLFVKRQFLDYLALKYPFDVPQKMVDKEFSTIWNQMLSAWGLLPPASEKERAGWIEKTPEERAAIFQKEAEKTEAELKEDYQRIAERRVRLGLILAEIGKREKIALSAEEVAAVIREKSKEFPGQEAEAARYYRENQQANMALQAPFFEKKIVEFALSTASCEKKEISFSQLEELFEKDDVNF
jgi:trigger factor